MHKVLGLSQVVEAEEKSLQAVSGHAVMECEVVLRRQWLCLLLSRSKHVHIKTLIIPHKHPQQQVKDDIRLVEASKNVACPLHAFQLASSHTTEALHQQR